MYVGQSVVCFGATSVMSLLKDWITLSPPLCALEAGLSSCGSRGWDSRRRGSLCVGRDLSPATGDPACCEVAFGSWGMKERGEDRGQDS